MKKMQGLALGALMLVPTFALAYDIYSPDEGVLCDTASYVLSNGVDCRSGERACMAERRGNAVEARYTKHLFGN